jgi:hypothetical protein
LLSFSGPPVLWGQEERTMTSVTVMTTTTTQRWWMIVAAAALAAPGWTAQFFGTTTLLVVAQQPVSFCRVVIVKQWAKKEASPYATDRHLTSCSRMHH